MKFHVGPFLYTLAISDRQIFDVEGNPLEGAAVESRRLIIISYIVELERRAEVLMHELIHCWAFHVPQPSDEEERANLVAMITEQFHRDLESQDGREALAKLQPQRVPQLGSALPAPRLAFAREVMGSSDRMICAACDADVMCGSIHHGEPELHEATAQWRILRWFQCDACAGLQIWYECCAPDGSPLGTFIANPKPRLLRGAEASLWLSEHSEPAASR